MRALRSRERRVNLRDDNGHPFARRRLCRGPRETNASSPLSYLLSSLWPILIPPRYSDGPRVLRDPSFSSLAIPPAGFLPRAIRWYTVSPCAPITRRNAHLVRGGGPIMVSNHSKLLSTHGFSPLKHMDGDDDPPARPRIFNPSSTAHRLPISRKALSANGCVLHVGVDGLHFLSR